MNLKISVKSNIHLIPRPSTWLDFFRNLLYLPNTPVRAMRMYYKYMRLLLSVRLGLATVSKEVYCSFSRLLLMPEKLNFSLYLIQVSTTECKPT